MSVTVVGGALQPYAWGRHNALLPFKPDAPAGPHAELWFGTHPAAPSEHIAGDQPDAAPAALLVKILAAASPLSIQVHPDNAGIQRLLADAGTAALLADHAVKDEALIAVEPFDVLAGFRTAEDAARLFAAAGASCADVVSALASGDVLQAARILLAQPRHGDMAAMCAAMLDDQARIMAQVAAAYADDPAVLVAFLMHPRTLQPGEAMYVPAGSVHAYVSGLGVEVMTSSDNVLRLGLTPKAIAIEPALSITNPELRPVVADMSISQFAPAGAPFAVTKVVDAEVSVQRAQSIALAYDGEVADIGTGLIARKGQAFLLHTGGHTMRVAGTAYLASPA